MNGKGRGFSFIRAFFRRIFNPPLLTKFFFVLIVNLKQVNFFWGGKPQTFGRKFSVFFRSFLWGFFTAPVRLENPSCRGS